MIRRSVYNCNPCRFDENFKAEVIGSQKIICIEALAICLQRMNMIAFKLHYLHFNHFIVCTQELYTIFTARNI